MTGTPGPPGTPGSTGPPPFVPQLLESGYYVEWNGLPPIAEEQIEGDGPEGPTNYYPTVFSWPSININFDSVVTDYVQNISGIVRGYKIYSTEVGGTSFQPYNIPYILTKLTIESCNTGGSIGGSCRGGQWKDEEYDNRYGGVFLYTEQTPVSKLMGQPSVAGTLGGKVNDVNSGYIYDLVFDQSDFEYYIMNSGKSDGKFKNTFTDSNFKREPLYENVVDKFGRHAPIYPMDTIVKFIPDEREVVYVKYTVSLEASLGSSDNDDSITGGLPLKNGNIIINHAVTQDTGNFNEKFRQLLSYCNYSNPGNFSSEQLSRGYPIDYPYTIISEFAPTERSTQEEPDGKLKKGDVWYNPQTNQRYYYSINDSPDSLEIVDPGRSYSFLNNLQTSYIPTQEEKNNPRADVDLPYDVHVNITVDDIGRITSAQVVGENYPNESNYRNGDMLAIPGGNGQGKARVVINSNINKWTDRYTEEEL